MVMEEKHDPPRSQEVPLYDARPTLPLRPIDPDAPPPRPPTGGRPAQSGRRETPLKKPEEPAASPQP